MDKTKKTGLRPVLIIDQLSKDFGKANIKSQKNVPKISEEEKILLTLIARIIVDIIIKEEL